MKSAIDAGVPVLVFVAMFVVGTDLTTEDFRRVARQRGIVLAAIFGQVLFLPIIGWLLVHWLKLPLGIAQGLLLVTACPSGTMATVYALLARANVALSVTLTAVSCLAAIVTTPLALIALQTLAGESSTFVTTFGTQAGQLLLMLVLPVVAGMGLRYGWPQTAARYRQRLLGLSVTILVALLAIVVVQEWKQFASSLDIIIVTVALLTFLAFGVGWATGWACGAGLPDRFTLGLVFVVRNVGIATAIAVTALNRVEFAVFATAYFLAQAPVLLVGSLLFRISVTREQNALASVELP